MAKIVSIEYIRAIAIILVVIGHFIPEYSPDWWKTVNLAIYSFHMPLFLIISGYVYMLSTETDYARLIRKKLIRLIIPYLSTSIIVISIKLLFSSGLKLDNPVETDAFVKILILPVAGYFLWYIFVLFESFLVVGLLRRRRNLIYIMTICSFIFYFIPIDLPEYFCLRQFKQFFPFFMLGVIASEIPLKRYSNFTTLIISVLIWSVSFYTLNNHTDLYDIIFPVSAISGTIATAVICDKLQRLKSNLKPLITLSVCSYFIYLFHTTFEGLAKGVISKLTDNSETFFVGAATIVVATGIIFPVLIFKLFERYKLFCFLFGLPYTDKRLST